MTTIPITATFSSDMERADFTFEDTNHSNLKVAFKVTYRRGKAKQMFSGEGYTGEIMANDLL